MVSMVERLIRHGLFEIITGLSTGSCRLSDVVRKRGVHWHLALSSESRIFLKKSFADLKPWFELKQDGTFVAVDLPQSRFFVRGQWQEFVMRGHGTWELGTHQNRPVVRLQFQELVNYKRAPEDAEGRASYSTFVYIYHSRSDFYLFYYDDDPEMGREMRFRKEQK